MASSGRILPVTESSILRIPVEVMGTILDFILPLEWHQYTLTVDPAVAPSVLLSLQLRLLHSRLNEAVIITVLRWMEVVIDNHSSSLSSMEEEKKSLLQEPSALAAGAGLKKPRPFPQDGNALYQRLYLLALRQASPEEQTNSGFPPQFGETTEKQFARGIKSLPPYALEGLRLRRSLPLDFFAKNVFLVKVDLSSPLEVERIEDGCFSECTALKSIDLKGLGKVGMIGARFLAGCTALEEVDLTPLVCLTDLGTAALFGCRELKLINLAELHRLETIGNQFLALKPSSRGWLSQVFASEDYDQVQAKIVGLETLTGLMSIGEAFLKHRSAVPVASPVETRSNKKSKSQKKSQSSGKCDDNSRNELLLLSLSIRSIATDFCAMCSGVRTIDLRFCTQLTTIPDGLCKGANDIQTVVFPPGLTSIGNEVLKSCRLHSLPNFHELRHLTVIGDSFGFGSTLHEIQFPPGLRKIGDQCLERSYSLKKVELTFFGGNNSDWGLSFGDRCFAECSSLREVRMRCEGVPHRSVDQARLNLIRVGDFFATCSNALHQVDVQSWPLGEVGCGFFDSCANLEALTLPKTLHTIGPDFLSCCVAVVEVDLSECNRLGTIPESFLRNCRSLRLIHFPDARCEQDTGTQPTLTPGVKVVPSAPRGVRTLSTRMLEGTGLFNSVVEVLACCSSSSASSSSAHPDENAPGQKQSAAPNSLSLLWLPLSLEMILYGFMAKAPLLLRVDLSLCAELVFLGDGVFAYCPNLYMISLPTSLKTIGNRFLSSTAVEVMDLAPLVNLSTIGSDFCISCRRLNKVVLPGSVSHIGTDFLAASQPAIVDLTAVAPPVIAASMIAKGLHLFGSVVLPKFECSDE